MTLRLYNTLTRHLEPFEPLKPPAVGLYACGPTVYDEPHLGHLRSAFVFDLLRRYLTHAGFQVRFIRNVTDVDDKIIEKARHEAQTSDLKKTCEVVATKYLSSYHAALAQLGIEPPTVEPKATEHVVPEMTDLISKLLMEGTAYEAGGDVYFAVQKFDGYGRLSNRSVDELQVGARVEPGEQKRDPMDFALWKSAKPDEPSWSSPWGAGRPGWHIECSAMSGKYLGDAFDIHGGGLDLIFPHHENEIAQSRAAGRPFAKYWVHHGLVTVNGEKMSKSLGNFVTVDQVLQACGGNADVLKMFFLGTHYRNPIDYSTKLLQMSQARFKRLRDCLRRTDELRGLDVSKELFEKIKELKDAFLAAMDDDLNTPQALAVLDNVVYAWNTQAAATYLADGLHKSGAAEISRGRMLMLADILLEFGQMLGLFRGYQPVKLSSELKRLLAEREKARKSKNFDKADVLREEISNIGFVVEDTPSGPVVFPKR